MVSGRRALGGRLWRRRRVSIAIVARFGWRGLDFVSREALLAFSSDASIPFEQLPHVLDHAVVVEVRCPSSVCHGAVLAGCKRG
jgi:hypothetical protein